MRVHQAGSSSTPIANISGKHRSVLKNKNVVTFESKERRKRRRKPGSVALKQIKYYQQTTNLLLQGLPFQRLVREIVDTININTDVKYRWQVTALQVLQFAVEAYMISLLEDTQKAAVHAKRITIRPEDMHLVRAIRGTVNPNEIF